MRALNTAIVWPATALEVSSSCSSRVIRSRNSTPCLSNPASSSACSFVTSDSLSSRSAVTSCSRFSRASTSFVRWPSCSTLPSMMVFSSCSCACSVEVRAWAASSLSLSSSFSSFTVDSCRFATSRIML